MENENNYLKLSEAIISKARLDYIICTRRLMTNRYRHQQWKFKDVDEYLKLKKFWKTGCNGLVGEDVFDSINVRLKVDTDKIEKIISTIDEAYAKYREELRKADMKHITFNTENNLWYVQIGKKYIGSSPDFEEAKEIRDKALNERKK